MGAKVAVSAAEPKLTALVEHHFGRCAAFVIVDTDTMEWKGLENASAHADGGAGVKTAEALSQEHVEAVLTGSCGPNAYQVLKAAGIRIVTDVAGRVDYAVEAYKRGSLLHDHGG